MKFLLKTSHLIHTREDKATFIFFNQENSADHDCENKNYFRKVPNHVCLHSDHAIIGSTFILIYLSNFVEK